jgi:hypothetical protein
MSNDTALGDYPQGRNWFVQSFGKNCTASSSLTDHAPAPAADENVAPGGRPPPAAPTNGCRWI